MFQELPMSSLMCIYFVCSQSCLIGMYGGCVLHCFQVTLSGGVMQYFFQISLYRNNVLFLHLMLCQPDLSVAGCIEYSLCILNSVCFVKSN